MELIDRYLKTLRSGLPEAQREDIVRELSENIYSEIEEKESAMGRALGPEEVEAILKQHGNPLVVASRYRQDQRSLSFGRQIIGPTLFPFYARVLRFNLGLTAVIVLVIFGALLASGEHLGFREALATLFFQLFIQFAFATAIFAGLDRQMAKNPDRWEASAVNQACWPGISSTGSGKTVSRMESASQLVALLVFVVWLRAIGDYPFLIFGPAAAFLKAAPVWRQMYFPLMLIALLSMAQAAVNLVRPRWVMLRSLARVASGTGSLLMCYFLLKAGRWVLPANENAANPHVTAVINQVAFYSLIVCAVIAAVNLARDLRRLIRGSLGSEAQNVSPVS